MTGSPALETFERRDGVLLERRIELDWLGLALAVLFIMLLITLAPAHPALLPPTLILMMFLVVGHTYVQIRHPRVLRGTIYADNEGLRCGNKWIARREAVEAAYVRQRRSGMVLRLERRWTHSVDCVVDEATASALVVAMRLDGARAVLSWHANRASFSRSYLRVAALMTCCLGVGSAILRWETVPMLRIGATFLVALLCFIFAARGMCRIVVGADGVRFSRYLGRNRFIRYTDLADISTDGTDVSFTLQRGERLFISFGAGRWVRRINPTLESSARALTARVRERMQAHDAALHGEVESVISIMVRGGRSTDAWLHDVTCSHQVASFRVSTPPPDVLLAVASDETAPAEARAAAGIALRRTAMSEESRKRLRVAADACADVNLRDALTRLASDDVALDEAATLESVTAATGVPDSPPSDGSDREGTRLRLPPPAAPLHAARSNNGGDHGSEEEERR
jgi:hypothetical protein